LTFIDMVVHTPVTNSLTSLFLAKGHALTRNSLGMLLITQLLLRRGLDSHQYWLDFAISEFDALLMIM